MNIPLPTPPTDNLYKFMALLGSLLLIVALALPSMRKEEFHREYTDKLDKLNVVGRELQQAIEVGQSPDDPKHAKEVDRTVGFLMAESENLARWQAQRQEIVKEQESTLSLARWGGSVIAIIGFTLWYMKVQRWDDRIKQLEFEKKKLEAAPSTNGSTPPVPQPKNAKVWR